MAKNIVQGETGFKIRLVTDEDLTNEPYSEIYMNCQKPDNTRDIRAASWDGTSIVADYTELDFFTIIGDYYFWAQVNYLTNKIRKTLAVKLTVVAEGTYVEYQ